MTATAESCVSLDEVRAIERASKKWVEDHFADVIYRSLSHYLHDMAGYVWVAARNYYKGEERGNR